MSKCDCGPNLFCNGLPSGAYLCAKVSDQDQRIFGDVVRSSGGGGLCDTIFGTAYFKYQACVEDPFGNYQIPMPDVLKEGSIYANITVCKSDGNCEDYSNTELANGCYLATGYPVTWNGEEFFARFSTSVCGISLTGCPTSCTDGTGLDINPFETTYSVTVSIEATGLFKGCVGWRNNQFIPFSASQQDLILTEKNIKEACSGPKVRPLNPFVSSGVDPNTWKISNEAIDLQSSLPENTGVYSDGSYIGGFGPTPSGIQPF